MSNDGAKGGKSNDDDNPNGGSGNVPENGESGGPSDPPETLVSACEEAQASLERQIKVLSDIDTKAIKLFRMNLLLITILVTGLSIAVKTDASMERFVNVHTVAGSISLLFSIATSGITYAGSTLEVGISHNSLHEYIEGKPDPKDHYELLAKGYVNWLGFNDLAIWANGYFSTVMIVLSVNAIFLFVSGAAVGILQLDLTHNLILLLIVSVGLAIVDFLIVRVGGIVESVHDRVKTYQTE